ncbi:hypothetical protein RR48_02591 [Papilio machaon]|uniref:Uncharacterized protein n=1 Tax=Papilio machaon TaxID=76193 RepID=A0A0N1PJ13_PAPMA|nr:hypothetical protein RR48_02591 [Papilio machaon]
MSDLAGEWDRRKTYLTRCLFEDLPLLSPIPERREPDQSETNDLCSALPDLIIEKEKNRHDEPEEFYQELEKKMLRLYRKLFLCHHEDGSFLSINSTSSYDVTELIEDEIRQDSDNEVSNKIPFDGTVFTPGDESTRISDGGTDKEPMYSLPQDCLIQSDDECSEEPRHEIITIEAMIHTGEDSQRNRKRVNEEISYSMAAQSPIIGCKHVQQINEDWDEQTSDRRLSTQDATFASSNSPLLVSRVSFLDENEARLVAKQAITQKYSKSTSHDFEVYDFSPIEVMRQKRNEDSNSSIPEVRHNRRSSMEPEFVKNLNENEASPVKMTQTYIEEEMASDVVRSDRVSQILGEGDLRNNTLRDLTTISSPVLETISRKRLRSDSWDASQELPKKRMKYKDIGLQTTIKESFSNVTQPCCEQPPTNYFYGTPMILNICRCKDHTCES